MEYYKCNVCGGALKKIRGDQYKCKSCGNIETLISVDDWVTDDFYSSPNADDIPEGCATCGGPYPDCKISCNMFDD